MDSTNEDHLWEQHEQAMDALVEFCGSDDGSFSLSALQESVEKIRQIQIPTNGLRTILHHACTNKRVTLEIVRYILTLYPGAANYQADEDYYWEIATAFPLPLACANDSCPNSIIELLLEKNPSALCHPCLFGDNPDIEYGLPVHYYISRSSNVDIDIIKSDKKNRFWTISTIHTRFINPTLLIPTSTTYLTLPDCFSKMMRNFFCETLDSIMNRTKIICCFNAMTLSLRASTWGDAIQMTIGLTRQNSSHIQMTGSEWANALAYTQV